VLEKESEEEREVGENRKRRDREQRETTMGEGKNHVDQELEL